MLSQSSALGGGGASHRSTDRIARFHEVPSSLYLVVVIAPARLGPEISVDNEILLLGQEH